MQNLDVISINLWQILISLCNLIILFLILKKFLYKPVRRILNERQAAIDRQYSDADEAKRAAEAIQEDWENKMQNAKTEADIILKKAFERADLRSEKMIANAKRKADGIIREAEEQAVTEHKNAQDEIKKEIVYVSAALTEKILEREINTEDHHNIIDKVISKIGESDD